MKNETDEFSFILKPSDYGVGVFVTHDITEGTLLDLWEGEARLLDISEVPEPFRM